MSYSSDPDARRTTTNGKGDVADSIHTLKEDATKLAGSIGSMAKDEIAKGREQVSEMGSTVADSAQTLFSELEQRVRARPAAALGVTLGVGLLLGVMLAGGRR